MTSPKDVSHSVINRGLDKAPLWLASASPRRADLLGQIGISPARIIPAAIDETPLKREIPRLYAARMAAQKAQAVYVAQEVAPKDIFILAADTVVCVGRRILEKTDDEAQARYYLSLLSGRAHRVWTGVCVSHNATTASRLCETRVRFGILGAGDIDNYIASAQWRGKAGAYAIQGLAARYITTIVGSYSNVVGLPLYETANLLSGLGYKSP